MHTLSPKVFIGGRGAGDHKQSFLFVLAYVFRMSHFQVLNDELQSFYLWQSRFKAVEINLSPIFFACRLFKFWTTNCSRFISGLSCFKAVEFNLNSNRTNWRRSEVKWSELGYWKKWDDNLRLIWWKNDSPMIITDGFAISYANLGALLCKSNHFQGSLSLNT